MIYLDNAANTPIDPLVADVFNRVSTTYYGNPNSVHMTGSKCLSLINNSLDSIREYLGLDDSYEIIPLASATEANNLAIRGIAESYSGLGKKIISTVLEHPSVGGSLAHLKGRGWNIDLVNINKNGQIDLDHLQSLITSDTSLVSIVNVDSELGTKQPITKVLDILKDYPHCKLHTDSTQAVGKISSNFYDADCITFAPHKFHGYTGIGFLCRKKKTILTPFMYGGSNISLYRSGTLSTALIASSAKAVELAYTRMEQDQKNLAVIQSIFHDRIKKYNSVTVFSGPCSSPYIINMGIAHVPGEEACRILDNYGVCASSKSACSPKGMPSKAVFAITTNKTLATSSFRISFGRTTTPQDILDFLDILPNCFNL